MACIDYDMLDGVKPAEADVRRVLQRSTIGSQLRQKTIRAPGYKPIANDTIQGPGILSSFGGIDCGKIARIGGASDVNGSDFINGHIGDTVVAVAAEGE